jgi:hypothetical protein
MELAVDQHGHRVQALGVRANHHKAYSGTAGTTDSAVSRKTSVVMITCTTAAYVSSGLEPAATSADTYVAADVSYFFKIEPGHKVSAVQVSSSGMLHVTEQL